MPPAPRAARGFSPPRRLAPPRPCRSVSPCCRSWGSPCFRPATKRGFPTTHSCPSKPSLRRQRRPRLAPWTWASVTHRPLLACTSPLALPPRPYPSPLGRWFPTHPATVTRGAVRSGASRPCSIVGSVARSTLAGRSCSVLPWAWLTRPRRACLRVVLPRARMYRGTGSGGPGGPHVRTGQHHVKEHSEECAPRSDPQIGRAHV